MNTERHEDLCARLAAGELRLDDAEVLAYLDEEPTMRDELEDMARLGAALEGEAVLRREVLALAEQEHEAPGASAIGSSIRDAIAAEGAPAASTHSRPALLRAPWGPLAAAAAVLLVVALYFRDDDVVGPPRVDDPLGGGIEELQPTGETSALESFTWSSDLAPGGWFLVRVWGEQEQLLLESGRLHDATWTPTAAELEALDGALRWEVERYDAQGIADARADAELVLP